MTDPAFTGSPPRSDDAVLASRDFYERLDSMRDLKPDWNSYGAVPTTDEAIRTAEALTCVPTVNGGVQIELHAGGFDLEVEIDADGTLESVCWGKAEASDPA